MQGLKINLLNKFVLLTGEIQDSVDMPNDNSYGISSSWLYKQDEEKKLGKMKELEGKRKDIKLYSGSN